MAKRRTPPRVKSGPKKGQFRRRAARARSRPRKRRRNPGRTVQRAAPRANQPKRRRKAAVRRAPARKRRPSIRRNPRRVGVVQTFTDGIVEAGQILIGKAAVRSIPALANLPKQGNVGLAVQAGTAVVIGYVAEMFLSRSAARAMTAGALTAPLETLIVAYKVPWLSAALAPVTSQNGLQAYVRGNGGSLGRYVRRPSAGSSERGLGRYATERGMDYGYGS